MRLPLQKRFQLSAVSVFVSGLVVALVGAIDTALHSKNGQGEFGVIAGVWVVMILALSAIGWILSLPLVASFPIRDIRYALLFVAAGTSIGFLTMLLITAIDDVRDGSFGLATFSRSLGSLSLTTALLSSLLYVLLVHRAESRRILTTS